MLRFTSLAYTEYKDGGEKLSFGHSILTLLLDRISHLLELLTYRPIEGWHYEDLRPNPQHG
jgi:hypothetical protein